MMKRILIILFSSFLGIIGNPEFLTASDSVVLTGLNETNIVETVALPEPETAEVSSVAEVAYEDTAYYETYYEPVYEEYYEEYYYEEPAPYIPANNIAINGDVIALEYTNSTAENAGSEALAWYYKTGKFIYGHNAWNVFGFLDSAYDGGWLGGMDFSVTMNGSTSYYTVVNYRLYDYDASSPLCLWYNGTCTKMNPVVGASLDGVSYRMAIMTCYAGSSKRLVVFAN